MDLTREVRLWFAYPEFLLRIAHH
jgi:CheY-like chemotaxis protein